jgi:Electron transfer DM13
MKLRFIPAVLAICVLLIACKKETTTDTAPVNDTFDVSTATLIRQGNFVNGGYQVSGTAKIYSQNGVKKLYIEGLNTMPGPDLKIYISANGPNINNAIRLGNLKSTTGNQLYDISGMPDFTQFNTVVIWCERFSALWGSAPTQ